MKEQRISIEIDEEGRISADADGFTDDKCIEELEALLEGLAVVWEHVEEKPDATSSQIARRNRREISTGRKG
ncbi:MAG: DUF2997 domain-containing protein [Deltaproteobacteria bacterium]|nr:MAG: DUF2997 domain-containing protein [Deltaproteobacteria bacterium]